MTQAILWQRLEGAVLFLAGMTLFISQDTGLSWWAALLIFFAPDLAFAGYALGSRIGANLYNLVHLYAFGAVLLVAGLVTANPVLAGIGALFVAHAGFDRMFGYGLKSTEGFSFTHLGRIGRAR